MLNNCLISDNYEDDKCLSCERGFFLNEKTFKCAPCSSLQPGCSECASNYCFRCEQGYNLVDGDCLSDDFTIPFCLERSGKSCLKCDSNFMLRNGTCICDKQYTLQDNKCQLCSETIENCVSCSQDAKCTQCESGLFVTPEGKCSDSECFEQFDGICTKCNI